MAKILLIGSQDWLFARRHLPVVRAARELDLDVVVVVRAGGHHRLIQAVGARVLDTGPDIGSGIGPREIWRSAKRCRALITAEKPDMVQFFGMRPALAGALAAKLSPGVPSVFAFNGLGAIARQDGALAAMGLALARQVTMPLAGAGNWVVFDNPDDGSLLGLHAVSEWQPDRATVRILPGSGVDPLLHGPEPMPWLPPLKLVFGSPLLWANGPDLAVEAVSQARRAGADVSLSLIGLACQPGRASVPEATLNAWSRLPGVNWFAPTADVGQIWRQHHALILPSRGGDGLPPILTEAASAARCSVVTDVDGCRSFVRDGIDGFVVPKSNATALGDAIVRLARAPGLVERMGRSAREHVLGGYTERHVMDALKRLWRDILAGRIAR